MKALPFPDQALSIALDEDKQKQHMSRYQTPQGADGPPLQAVAVTVPVELLPLAAFARRAGVHPVLVEAEPGVEGEGGARPPVDGGQGDAGHAVVQVEVLQGAGQALLARHGQQRARHRHHVGVRAPRLLRPQQPHQLQQLFWAHGLAPQGAQQGNQVLCTGAVEHRVGIEGLDDADDHVCIDTRGTALPVNAADSPQPIGDENLQLVGF